MFSTFPLLPSLQTIFATSTMFCAHLLQKLSFQLIEKCVYKNRECGQVSSDSAATIASKS